MKRAAALRSRGRLLPLVMLCGGLLGSALAGASCTAFFAEEGPGLPPAAEETCADFELSADTARDRRTGLVWDRVVFHDFATHTTAEEICAAKGARLPTRAELTALRTVSSDDACQLPACPFRGDRCATIQCGTPIAGTDAHWGVAFSGGAEVMVGKENAEALLCVR